jgi:hypothetical protein
MGEILLVCRNWGMRIDLSQKTERSREMDGRVERILRCESHIEQIETRQVHICNRRVFYTQRDDSTVQRALSTQFVPHRRTLRLRYRAQPVNAM